MNILAVDYGKKRIGLAWAQSGLDVVLPFGIIEKLDELVVLIKEENIDKVLFGLPTGLDGKENENTIRVKNFVNDLKKEIDIPVKFIDERFTSRQADQMGGDVSRDEKSAMIILESYLQKDNNK